MIFMVLLNHREGWFYLQDLISNQVYFVCAMHSIFIAKTSFAELWNLLFCSVLLLPHRHIPPVTEDILFRRLNMDKFNHFIQKNDSVLLN
jgi:hypothetical protein